MCLNTLYTTSEIKQILKFLLCKHYSTTLNLIELRYPTMFKNVIDFNSLRWVFR